MVFLRLGKARPSPSVGVEREYGHVERDGQTIVTAKIDGTFDRTGLPDPLLMEHCFTVTGDKIATLTCRLAVEAPKA